MAKPKSVYICQHCGAQSPKWVGKCPSCNEWNTFIEEVIIKEPTNKRNTGVMQISNPELLNEIKTSTIGRIDTLNGELNRVLGGGLVPGSLVLIGGEPGIGKSTLVLQLALQLKQYKILYVSGEESNQQIKLRAQRLGMGENNCFILAETHLETILYQFNTVKPDIVIIDSIQTLYSEKIESSPGSISQTRECTNEILRYAKSTSTPIIIIGHINKDGNIAGPKALEHIVDTVLQFEGDTNYMFRILRAAKNRFGSTSELGIYEMTSKGLKEVLNPSELLLSHHNESLSGTAIAATIEGMRPFLIEVQALVSSAVYGTPQRSATGFDTRRLNMLLAVLEKRAGFKLATKDVFLNMAGGIRVDDTAADLPVISAILSSNIDIPLAKNICFAAEVGLSGEIRPVTRIEQRISEADKLGFQKIIISKFNTKGINLKQTNIEICMVGRVDELPKKLFT